MCNIKKHLSFFFFSINSREDIIDIDENMILVYYRSTVSCKSEVAAEILHLEKELKLIVLQMELNKKISL